MASVVDRTVTTPDGRTIAVQEGGDPHGRPVLAHRGWLISHDRPGYGGSTAQPGRTIADCAASVRAIAAALCIERTPCRGSPGAGRTRSPVPRCSAISSRPAMPASPAPYGARGLDFWEGLGELDVEDGKLMIEDPATVGVGRAGPAGRTPYLTGDRQRGSPLRRCGRRHENEEHAPDILDAHGGPCPTRARYCHPRRSDRERKEQRVSTFTVVDLEQIEPAGPGNAVRFRRRALGATAGPGRRHADRDRRPARQLRAARAVLTRRLPATPSAARATR